MQLSFSHIMKHWKRNPNQPGASKVPGARNVLLRFYPPQSAIRKWLNIEYNQYLWYKFNLQKTMPEKRRYMNSKRMKKTLYDVQ